MSIPGSRSAAPRPTTDPRSQGDLPLAASDPPTEPPTYWELEAELPSAAEEMWSLFCYEQGATGAEWREESGPRLRIAYFFDGLRNP